MKFLLSLLLAFPLFGKQSERYYQEKFAREIGGQVEVVMKDGTRCDILTATHAIEVDFARKWAEAIGQSLNYSMLTDRKAGVVLILENESDEKHLKRLETIIASKELDIEVFVMLADDGTNPLADTRGEHIVKLLAIGKIDRIVLSDDGKEPKTYHEFSDVDVGWEKQIPFTDAFRCFASNLENLRFSVDGGNEKEVSGKGAGKFSWGNLSEDFWISLTGKTHTKSCKYFGQTKGGKFSDKPTELKCKMCFSE
jgi:hypothetical protein